MENFGVDEADSRNEQEEPGGVGLLPETGVPVTPAEDRGHSAKMNFRENNQRINNGNDMKKIKESAIVLSVLAAVLALGQQAHGVTINGGIGLLTTAGGTQLESWLGEGPLALTSIFSHQVGDGKFAEDFHAAADGQGRTFAIMEVLKINGVAANEIIGGYNPQSWNSSRSYNLTPNYADRTAAIFNLTDLVWRPQNTDGSGLYETYNGLDFGPTFGGGHDIFTQRAMFFGYVFPNSYGVTGGVNILGGTAFQEVQYGRIEVFTIAAASASSVPDAGNTAMMLGGGLVCVFGLLGRRRSGSSCIV